VLSERLRVPGLLPVGISLAVHAAAVSAIAAVPGWVTVREPTALVAQLVPADPPPDARAEPPPRVRSEPPRAPEPLTPPRLKVAEPPPAPVAEPPAPAAPRAAPPPEPPRPASAATPAPSPIAPEATHALARQSAPAGVTAEPFPPAGNGEAGAPAARPAPPGAGSGPAPGGAAPAAGDAARVAPGTGDGITQTAHPRGGYQVRPSYPSSARRLGAQGTTLLRVHVAADGRVSEVRVESSAGHPDLDRAASEAVARWRFEPARRGTEPVAMWVRLPVEFRLR
jgi:protein TonB